MTVNYNCPEPTWRSASQEYPRTFMLFCRQVLATDFKAMHRVQLGEAPQRPCQRNWA